VQDAQEFSKLFMALLETDPAMCHFIQQQFMGQYEYLTWLVLTYSRSFLLCCFRCCVTVYWM